MVESCRSKRHAWVTHAAADTGKWIREPEHSVFDHTFRDRHAEAELGPANGHISARKYIPRYDDRRYTALDHRYNDTYTSKLPVFLYFPH